MSTNRELSLLGLAKKAGRLAVGNEPVLEALHFGRAEILLFACDAADNTVRRFENRRGDVTAITLPYSKEELGAAIGYKSCAALAICDPGFAGAFLKAHTAMSGNLPEGHSNREPKDTTN